MFWLFPKFNDYIEDYELIKNLTLLLIDEQNVEVLMWNKIEYLRKLRNNNSDDNKINKWKSESNEF